jgi:histidine ammonia-lyase
VRGVELRDAEPGAGVAAARDAVRAAIPGIGPDRWLAPELAEVETIVGDGTLVAAVEAITGPLD